MTQQSYQEVSKQVSEEIFKLKDKMIRFGNFADLGISKEIPKKELDNIFLLLEKSYEEMLKNHPKGKEDYQE